MTTTAKPLANRLAPIILATATALAAWNWYLRPARAGSFVVTLLVLAAMTLAWLLARRAPAGDSPRWYDVNAIPNSIVFAGLILIAALGAKLAAALGTGVGSEFSRRMSMVLLAGFFMFTGNAIPKTLPPAGTTACDGANAQRRRRLAGWTWVLTGLAYAVAAFSLPISLAETVSMVLLLAGTLVVAAGVARARRAR